MYEYKWSVGLRHKVTGARLNISLWAPTCDDATHKLTGTLIGSECEYEWTGTGPDYDNGPRKREVIPCQSLKEENAT